MLNPARYHPTRFFGITLVIAYIAYFMAAYVSYQSNLVHALFPLILAGMSSPSIAATLMFITSKEKILWNDFLQRLHLTRIKIRFVPFILFFWPCLIILAIAISWIFGFLPIQFDVSQFSADQALHGKSLFTIILTVLLSCSLEEIGWRGYGIDSLYSRYVYGTHL